MTRSLALIGLTVLVAGCGQAVTVEEDNASLATVHLVTSLRPDDNEALRERLGTILTTEAEKAPPTLMVMSESKLPAFNFHVESDCATATAYVRDLLTRAATAERLPMVHPDIACVEVGQ